VTRLDPRLVFLARAGARHILVAGGELNLDEAIAGLIAQFDEIVGPTPCACVRDMVERWERTHPPLKYRRGRR
jgi:hypothetical protein